MELNRCVLATDFEGLKWLITGPKWLLSGVESAVDRVSAHCLQLDFASSNSLILTE